MIKLTDLLKEIQEERQSIAKIEELLGRSLTEAELEELDLKRVARNLAVGAALGAATMFGSPKASAQTKSPTQPAAITQTVVVPSSLNQQDINNWNTFRDWAKGTSVEDIIENGDTTRLLSSNNVGNPILDKKEFNDKMVSKFKEDHPEAANILEPTKIGKFQEALVNHRNGTIEADKKGTINLVGGKYRDTDYSKYLPSIKRIENKAIKDGKYDQFAGQFTITIIPPSDLRQMTKTPPPAPTPKF